ncbi:MAG: CHASE2 domain-containing protein, partial [Myxococcales bacterium]
MKKHHTSSSRMAVTIGLLLSVVRFYGCTPLQLIDTRVVDMRMLQRGVQAASQDVVIVAVDDASIDKIGRWPWSRATMARLVRLVSAGEPSVIGFDVVQSESAAAPLLRGLQDRVDGVDDETWLRVHDALESWSDEDQLLADAIRDSGRVILGYFFDFGENPSGSTSLAVNGYGSVRESESGVGHRRLLEAKAAVGNLPILNDATLGSGYFNVFPDPNDGLYRRLPIAVRYGDAYAMPLSVAMVRTHRGNPTAGLRFAGFGTEEVRLGSQRIPVNEDGQMLLNFRGPRESFRHVAAADLLDGRIDPEVFRDKLVLVGVTATAVADIRPIPFDGVFPGVEIHATAIGNILRGDFLRQPKGSVLIEICAILLLACALGLVLRYVRGVMAALAALAFGGAYLVTTQWLFVRTGLPLGLVFPVLAIGIVYSVVSLAHFAAERGEKRQIREALGLYRSP